MEEQTVTTCTWHPNPVALEAKDMTLRDYFAAAALHVVGSGYSDTNIAHNCYRLADAMLAERERASVYIHQSATDK